MLIVKNEQDVLQALEFINANEMLAFDTETTGLNPRKDRVIGFGVSNSLEGFYVPIWTWNSGDVQLHRNGVSEQLVNTILVALSRKKILAFNASFDCRFTKYSLGIDLLPALYADVLLLKHTCDENFPLDLKGIGVMLYGQSAKAEKEEMQASVRTAGGTAKQYYKASLDLLAKYCVQDCLLTFRVYNHYIRDLQRQGLEEFYFKDEVLPLYKEVTIPMEERGVRLDIGGLTAALHEISGDLVSLQREIQADIAPLLTLFNAWFLNKEYPQQTWTGRVPAWRRKHQFAWQAWETENPGQFMFNLLSKHHLKKLFFDTLKEQPLNKTEKGNPQVDEDFLETMSKKYEWASKLIVYNKLIKLKGTYIERFLEEAENGRFYPSFMQHRTVSGRYSGDLQQLPRPLETGQADPLVVRHTNRIRSFFIPDDGCILLAADYEQLEPSIFAHTSGDSGLQSIFNSSCDFYSEVAIRTEALSGVSSDKFSPNYLGKLNKQLRQRAKAYALGIAYGMSGYKLQYELNIPLDEAEALVSDYLSAFPQLAQWMRDSQLQVQKTGVVKTQSGRIRHLGRAMELHSVYGDRLENTLQLWKDLHHNPAVYAEAKSARREYKNYMNNAVNFQVQGLAASIVNRAAIAIARTLKQKGLQAVLVIQCHDELCYNVPVAELSAVSDLVQSIMQTIMPLSVPLRTVPKSGTNYRECK